MPTIQFYLHIQHAEPENGLFPDYKLTWRLTGPHELDRKGRDFLLAQVFTDVLYELRNIAQHGSMIRVTFEFFTMKSELDFLVTGLESQVQRNIAANDLLLQALASSHMQQWNFRYVVRYLDRIRAIKGEAPTDLKEMAMEAYEAHKNENPEVIADRDVKEGR